MCSRGSDGGRVLKGVLVCIDRGGKFPSLLRQAQAALGMGILY